ncbi:MAG TPA: diaminopimelate epimerase [Dehalococcoidia bacterium]|jgi:diaminopimelate epimerase|nr:diaminopimelate epimerase [Dehalococcoidia bacterium]
MNFTKVQGAGNDFILVKTSDMQRDWSPVARALCDRHFGVGGDGLLLVLPSVVADFQMRIFNPDGSEAEVCGNGLRCLAIYTVDKGLTSAEVQEISVETRSGIRRITLHYDEDKLTKIQVGMGEPGFEAKDIPVMIEPGRGNLIDIKPILDYQIIVDGEELFLSFVSMGNPHAVYFWQYSVSNFPLSQLGPKIEQHKMFPQRVNFEVARIINRQFIEARVWERGVGETLACGSGACAVAVTAQLHGYIDNKVAVKLPGGILEVEWNGGGEVFLSGPVAVVFTGDWLE